MPKGAWGHSCLQEAPLASWPLTAGMASLTVAYYCCYHHPLTTRICRLSCEPGQGSQCVKPGYFIARARVWLILLPTTSVPWVLVVQSKDPLPWDSIITSDSHRRSSGQGRKQRESSVFSSQLAVSGIENRAAQRAWKLWAASDEEVVNSEEGNTIGNGLGIIASFWETV